MSSNMLLRLPRLLLACGLLAGPLLARGELFVGGTYGAPSGAGRAGNAFKAGPGLNLELGVFGTQWGVILAGFEYATVDNRVGSSTTRATFMQPWYLDVRRFLLSGPVRPFLAGGFGLQGMNMAGTKGWDYQYTLPILGAGVVVELPGRLYLQLNGKFTHLLSNSLGQNWQWEGVAGLGFFYGSAK